MQDAGVRMPPDSTLSSAEITDLERFRLFVASVTDYAIYILSPEGYINSWNAGAQRFKGYTQDEILGEHFSRFYTEEDRANGLPRRVLETAAREGKFEAEGWRLRKDGTRFWAHVVIDPIYNERRELVGMRRSPGTSLISGPPRRPSSTASSASGCSCRA